MGLNNAISFNNFSKKIELGGNKREEREQCSVHCVHDKS